MIIDNIRISINILTKTIKKTLLNIATKNKKIKSIN